MKFIYGFLRVINLFLSSLLIVVVSYAFVFRHFLVKLHIKFFDDQKDFKIEAGTFSEMVSICYLLFFGVTCLLYDTDSNFVVRKYCTWMKNPATRGFFHIWCAVAVWNIYPKSLPLDSKIIAKMFINCVAWSLLGTGVLEILISPF